MSNDYRGDWGFVANDPFFELFRGKEAPENATYMNIYIYSKYVDIIDITACDQLKVQSN